MWLNNHEWHLDYIRVAKDSSFSFERTKFPLDKNKICLLDLDKVIEEKDVAIIEQFLPSIVQYNIDTNEHIGIIDQNFLKMFRMSQLAVEYLLFCKKYLDHSVILLKEEIKDIRMENEELRIFNNELKKHTDTLLAKLKKRELSATFKCNKCLKAFSTEEYLIAHIDRRHTNKNNESFELGIETEIKEIKEKLNNTEKLIKNEEINPKLEDTLNKNYSKVSELLLKFESLRSQVENDFKMLHNQKDFEDKYLKVFQNALENVKSQINNELSLQSSPHRFHEKRNSITQTNVDIINTSEKIVQADEISESMERTEKTQLYEQKLEKLEVQIKSACENISNTMGSSLKNIEVQMQALWDKLQGLEFKKLTQELPDVNENLNSEVENELIKPTPKSRTRSGRSISNKSSEQMLMPKEIRSERNIHVRPSSDTRHNLLDEIEEKEISIDLNEVTVVKSTKLLQKPDDLDRIDVLDEIEPSKTITVVKSINSLYETEDLESEEEDLVLSSVVNSESELSPDKGSNIEYLSKETVLHKEKSGSTLGKRSISSLRRASLSSEVVERLKKEMKKVLMERLNMLGVSNEWKGIPEQTYSRVMDILNHQAKLVEKSVPDYKNIRKELLMKAEEEFCNKGSLKRVENQKKIKKTKVKGTYSPRSWSNKNTSLRIRKHQSAPQVEIRNRKMYESDSSSEEENKDKNLRKTASTIAQYSAVIEELKQTQKSEENLLDLKDKMNTSLPDNNLDLQMKGVLKNFPTTGPVPKKRVLFDLKSHNSEISKPVRDVGGGSTTSVASSVLDLSDESSPIIEDKKKPETELDIKDFSDSDFSILNSEKNSENGRDKKN